MIGPGVAVANTNKRNTGNTRISRPQKFIHSSKITLGNCRNWRWMASQVPAKPRGPSTFGFDQKTDFNQRKLYFASP
jgi:hypothetical protein